MLSIRPKVAEHALFLLGRSVHPELFQVYQNRISNRNHYKAKVDITSDGHLVTFTNGPTTVTEVICSANQLLPEKRRLASQIFRGKSLRIVESKRNICYQTEFEIQQVTADVFWMVQEQLSCNSGENDLLQNFDPSGRIPMGAVSYIHIEERQHQLIVQALHTFPDDYQILKSFSTFSVSDV